MPDPAAPVDPAAVKAEDATPPAPAELEVVDRDAQSAVLPAGVRPSVNYTRAVELGHVLAASGLYKDARDPAKAAVKVMIGMDLGVTPTAAMQGIHAYEQGDKIVFLIEGKLLAGVVKARPDVDYKIVERTDERCEIKFLRRSPTTGKMEKQEPNIVWTIEHARQAVDKFASKPTWKNYPAVMLTWRALAEGIRLHFPDVIAGQPVYLDEEFDRDNDSDLADALHPKAEPLTTQRAEELRATAREVFDELREINPNRMPPALFDNRIKGAEHSHERLEGVVASLQDLRDTERDVQALTAKVLDALDKAEAKKVIDTAERRSSNREKIEVLQAALADATIDADAEEVAGDEPAE